MTSRPTSAKTGVRPRPSSGKQKYSDSRRDSAEFNLERQIASPVVRFHQIQETRRKLSQSKEKKATSGSSFSSNIFDIVLTSTRPDQKTIEYFQNRPRTADSRPTSASRHSSVGSDASFSGKNKPKYNSYFECKRAMAEKSTMSPIPRPGSSFSKNSISSSNLDQIKRSSIQSNSSGISQTNTVTSYNYQQGGNKKENMRCWPFNKDVKPSQNGSSGSNVDSLLVEIERLKNVIIEKDKEIEKMKEKHNEELKTRQETIGRMQDIIDKSVGGIITLNRQQSRDENNANQKEAEKGPPVTKFLERPKKQRTGISAEPFNERIIVNTDPKVKKPVHTQAFLLAALKSNDFVKSLENEQLDQIVNCMQKKIYDPKTDIIVEGSVGERLYVLAAGKVQVLQNERVVHNQGSDTGGIVLGELALLYNCRRTATVRALTTCTLWYIDRSTFRQIMVSHNQTQREMHKLFLRKVSLLKTYSDRKINKLVDAMTVEEFQDNDVITREGSYGDVFYIILEGQVEVTKKQVGFIRSLSGGEYFGEKALLNEASIRTATCTAIGLVRCLTLDREAFVTLIGTTAERNYDDDHKLSISSNSSAECLTPLTPTGAMMIQSLPSFSDVRLTDLKPLGTLGVGGFGRVELVKCLRALPNKGTKLPSSFALKVMRKEHIVETSQEKHIFNERDILFSIDTKWVVKLYRTFRDRSFIYMLIEPCLGGELWTVLRNKGSFPEKWARFYTACCVEGLAYLHSKHIIYRDLKPENLVLDSRGFPKLCDFGFAKKIKPGHKAWTFCGTPEYVPPEIILNKGHDFSADFYALGIFIFELLTGNPPYNSADAMKVYRMALKGLESFPFPVDKISRSASQIIRHLAKEFPSERLGNGRNGIQDIKRNKWFTGFDWESLSSQTMEPPYVPTVTSATDLTNFDQFDEPEDDFMAADNAEESGWDKEF